MKKNQLSPIRFEDLQQTEVERRYLSKMTPTQISVDLGIPVIEVQQRVLQISHDITEAIKKISPEWRQTEEFEQYLRSQMRYRLHMDHVRQLIDPVRSLNGARSEDQYQRELMKTFVPVSNETPTGEIDISQIIEDVSRTPSSEIPGAKTIDVDYRVLEKATFANVEDLEFEDDE